MEPYRLAAIVLNTTILFIILYLLLKGVLREKYSLLWLLSVVTLLFFTIFPQATKVGAEWFGIQIPSNFLFILEIIYLLLISLYLSYSISKLSNQYRKIVQRLAIIEDIIENSLNTQHSTEAEKRVLSSFLCKIFLIQFLIEWLIVTLFPYRV